MIGQLVRCLNCKMLWRYVDEWSGGAGTVVTAAIQTRCPGCRSNAYEAESVAAPAYPEPATNVYICAMCGARYPVVAGYVHFCQTNAVASPGSDLRSD